MIYLDNNATTPLDPRVLEDMRPYFSEVFANPASVQHEAGRQAQQALEDARASVASHLGAEEREIVFTSGATEACNLALKGAFAHYRAKGKHLVVLKSEHKAVLDPVDTLARKGAEVSKVPVGEDGLVDLDRLSATIRNDTILVAAMWANNETGVVHPIEEIGSLCAQKGTLLFSDATQAVGKIPVDPRTCGVQMLACSAHKMHGPKGAGVLYISARSPRIQLRPQIDGGGHESGWRSGTVNLPGVIGLASALDYANDDQQSRAKAIMAMRDHIEKQLIRRIAARVNGSVVARLPHVTNLRIPGVRAEELIGRIGDKVALSTGSACTSADPKPSHVLKAMRLSTEDILASVRISVSRMNTMDEVHQAVELICDAVEHLRV